MCEREYMLRVPNVAKKKKKSMKNELREKNNYQAIITLMNQIKGKLLHLHLHHISFNTCLINNAFLELILPQIPEN